MWTLPSLLLLLVWDASVDCKNVEGINVEGINRPTRTKVNMTFSQTVAVTKEVDTDDLAGIKKIPPQNIVQPPGFNNGPNQMPPGLGLPQLDAPMPLIPNDGTAVVLPDLATLEPPQFSGGTPPSFIPGPTMPPMPPMPTGIDIDELEGVGGGQLGDRCPVEMKDENGKFPDVCYDVIDEDGACILDDIIAPKDDCIQWFGEDFYNEMVKTQQEIEENRNKALDQAGLPDTTQTPGLDEGMTEYPAAEAEENEAIEAEGRSVELEAPVTMTRRKTKSTRRGIPNPGARLSKVVRRNGPVMNTGVLSSLGNLETPMVGPTLGYFQSLRRKKKDGPAFNAGALNSLGYPEPPMVGPTLGYFQSLGRKRQETDTPKVNENALNGLGPDDKKNPNSVGYSPDSSSWGNSKVLPDARPSKP
ncbi:uncharacterized protein [Littorina saxatilis]|uniref:uncharacterized protein n=1 Tax=Littorina saxatilis TaxID=31220 RepID=UPI0038B470EB